MADFKFYDETYATKLIEDAIALRPLLEKKASKHEEIGELTDEVVAALEEIGALKMSAPVRCGGLCLSSDAQTKVMAEIAKGCPSTAWVVSIINSCVWLASAMSFEMQSKVFSGGRVPRICSPTNGLGSLENKDGNFVLNGKWMYGSASHHAEWALVPAKGPEDKMYFVALPMIKAEIERSWNVAGMKGTGSDTVVACDVELEPDLCCEIPGVGGTVSLHVSSSGLAPSERDDKRVIEATDYWVGLTLLRSKALAVLVGIVEGLLESAMKIKDRAIMHTSIAHRKDSAVYISVIGEVQANLWVVREILSNTTAINDVAAAEGRILQMEERIKSRGEVIVATELLTKSVDMLMNVLGSSAFVLSNPAQRYWRDFGVAVRHSMFNPDVSKEVVGRFAMGIEPNIAPDTFL